MFNGNEIREEDKHKHERKLSEHEIRSFEAFNVIGVPTYCPNGYRLHNGECVRVFSIGAFNVISAPTYCPDGYRLHNGICKRVF